MKPFLRELKYLSVPQLLHLEFDSIPLADKPSVLVRADELLQLQSPVNTLFQRPTQQPEPYWERQLRIFVALLPMLHQSLSHFQSWNHRTKMAATH